MILVRGWNLEGGEGQLYKDLERDQKAFLEREEVVGAEKLQEENR